MGDSGKMRYVSAIFYETNLENEYEVDASAVLQEA